MTRLYCFVNNKKEAKQAIQYLLKKGYYISGDKTPDEFLKYKRNVLKIVGNRSGQILYGSDHYSTIGTQFFLNINPYD